MSDFKRRAFVLGLDISGTGVRTHFASADRNRGQRFLGRVRDDERLLDVCEGKN